MQHYIFALEGPRPRGDLFASFQNAADMLAENGRLEMDSMPMIRNNRIPQSDASIGRDCGRHGTGVDGGTHEDGGNVVGGGPSEIPLNQDELPRQALPIQSPPDPPRERVLEDGLYLQEDSQQSMHFSRELSELAGAYTATIAILAHRQLACNWPHRRKILSSTPTTQGTWRRLFLSVWSRSTNSLQ